jgi:hypothetical protein
MNGVREELKNTQKEWVEEEEWQYKEEAPSVNMRRKLRYECVNCSPARGVYFVL